MRHVNMANWTVQQTAENIDGAQDVLHARNISATNRWTLANAAAATGETVDELFAVMEYRLRRAARQARPAEEVAETEAELVA